MQTTQILDINYDAMFHMFLFLDSPDIFHFICSHTSLFLAFTEDNTFWTKHLSAEFVKKQIFYYIRRNDLITLQEREFTFTTDLLDEEDAEGNKLILVIRETRNRELCEYIFDNIWNKPASYHDDISDLILTIIQLDVCHENEYLKNQLKIHRDRIIYQSTLLGLAVGYNSFHTVQFLLSLKVDPNLGESVNDLNAPPLSRAAYNNYLEIMDLLLADPDIQIDALYEDFTPLCAAAMTGQLESVKKLVSHGANVNGVVPEFYPICQAAKHGHAEVCRFLIESNAVFARAYHLTINPLRIACENLDYTAAMPIVNIFVAAGVNPATYAASAKDQRIKKILTDLEEIANANTPEKMDEVKQCNLPQPELMNQKIKKIFNTETYKNDDKCQLIIEMLNILLTKTFSSFGSAAILLALLMSEEKLNPFVMFFPIKKNFKLPSRNLTFAIAQEFGFKDKLNAKIELTIFMNNCLPCVYCFDGFEVHLSRELSTVLESLSKCFHPMVNFPSKPNDICPKVIEDLMFELNRFEALTAFWSAKPKFINPCLAKKM